VPVARFRIGNVNDLGIDRGAHGLQHAFFGTFGRQIDRAGFIPSQRDLSLARIDEGGRRFDDVSTRHIVRLDFIGRYRQAGFYRHDPGINDVRIREAAEVTHGHQIAHPNRRAGGKRLQPDAGKREHQKADDDEEKNAGENDYGI